MVNRIGGDQLILPKRFNLLSNIPIQQLVMRYDFWKQILIFFYVCLKSISPLFPISISESNTFDFNIFKPKHF